MANSKDQDTKDADADLEQATEATRDVEDETPATEPESETIEPITAEVEPRKKGGFFAALIGGILAACLGFLAARTEVLDPFLPDVLQGTDIAGLREELQAADAAQSKEILALRAEIRAIKQPDLAPIDARLKDTQLDITSLTAVTQTQNAHLRDLEARLNKSATRIDDLEKRPMTDSASKDAVAAYDRELETLRAAIAAQRAEVEIMVSQANASQEQARATKANAATIANYAKTQGAATRLFVALESGAAYDKILAEIVTAGVAVPDVLEQSAKTGVASLGSLRDAFPNAARLVLSAVRQEQGDDGGIAGFLQRQLGARSVEPREGNDPDAILSRAEAALGGGDLGTAMTELAALPDVARAQMQGWMGLATTRITALKAAEMLAQSLNSN